MSDRIKMIMNPTRLRIIQQLASAESMTAAELGEKISDIPRTTLYRHINILIDAMIVAVVSEKKIRGSLERTLKLNLEELVKNNTLENASDQIFTFLMDRYAKFATYFAKEKPDTGKDRIFYNHTVLMMTDEEFDMFLSELQQLFAGYNFEAADERKVRDITLISSPAEE